MNDTHCSISLQSERGRFRPLASLLAFSLAAVVTTSLAAGPSGRLVTIGNDGKLSGPLNGWAWVAGGEGASIAQPNPCNNSGCFKNTGGKLCSQGTIPALSCSGQGTPHYTCNWDKNWGVVLGMNTTHPQGPWGNDAPRAVTVNYSSVARGGSAGHFRLNAHVTGDPYSKQYCVDNYTPGAPVRPSDMKTQCWFGAGETLSSFARVDQIGLLRSSENAPVAFDFCVTAISVE
jgi:hypothetical protein